MRRSTDRGAKGFTLIELLVVMAILALLASLLFPAIGSARAAAQASACRGQLRQIGTALVMFANDHHGKLPGVDNIFGAQPWEKQWMGVEVALPGYTPSWCAAGHIGVLAPYLNVANASAATIYRCPGLPAQPLDSGLGSNGMFDYTMIKAFAGARLSMIPHTSILFYGTPQQRVVATPLVVEEDPEFFCNNGWIDTGHSNQDRLGSWHNGVGNYVALDGSVHSINARDLPEVPGLGHVGPSMLDWAFELDSGVYKYWESNIGFGQWHNPWREP